MIGKISKRPLKIIGYVVVFLLFLVLFTYTGFPVESLKMRIISEIKRNSPYDIEIGSMKFSDSLEMDFENVEIQRGNKVLKMDNIVVKPSLTDIISENMPVPFSANGLGGNITGTVYLSRNNRMINNFKVRIKGVDTSYIEEFMNINSQDLDIKGKINGSVNVDIAKQGNRYTAQGSYSFDSDKIDISNIKIQSFTLPGYNNLETDLKGTFDSRKTKIARLSFKNKDFQLSFFGTMPPVWQLSRGGKLDLFMNLNLYSNEAKMSFLKTFLSPQSDGTLAAKILGTVSNPRLVKGDKYEF